MARTAARAAGAQTTSNTGTHAGVDHDKRTPAQWYCLVFGGTLLAAGLLGFLANSSFVTGKELEGDPLLGVLDVNGWHNIVHLVSGAFLLAMSAKRATAKTAALAFGVVYGLVTVLGFADGSDILAIIPINTADNILHTVISALAIASGLASSGDDKAIDRHAGADRHKDHDGVNAGQRRVQRQPADTAARTNARQQPPVPPTRT